MFQSKMKFQDHSFCIAYLLRTGVDSLFLPLEAWTFKGCKDNLYGSFKHHILFLLSFMDA